MTNHTVNIPKAQGKAKTASASALQAIKADERADELHMARAILATEKAETPKQPATASLEREVKYLRDVVREMDGVASEGLSEIAVIARLALDSLENPETYLHLEKIAVALEAIWGKALEYENTINADAEGAGCSHTNVRRRRRSEAQAKAGELRAGVRI